MRAPTSAVGLPEALTFLQGLWAVVHRMERLSKQMAAAGGVTGPQRLTLRLLELFPTMSASELAALLHLHPSTLTGILQRLESQQLIVRSADPADGRRSLLRVTARGSRLTKRTSGTLESAVRAVLDGLSSSQRETTYAVLGQLATALDRELQPSMRR